MSPSTLLPASLAPYAAGLFSRVLFEQEIVIHNIPQPYKRGCSLICMQAPALFLVFLQGLGYLFVVFDLDTNIFFQLCNPPSPHRYYREVHPIAM
jgi:hypothetical protein